MLKIVQGGALARRPSRRDDSGDAVVVRVSRQVVDSEQDYVAFPVALVVRHAAKAQINARALDHVCALLEECLVQEA